MNNNIEKIVYGSNLTVFSLNGNGKILEIYNRNPSIEINTINIKIENADSTSYRTYTFPFESGQELGLNDYINSEGLNIDGNTIAFSAEQETAYQELQDIILYEGISHIIVTDEIPVTLKFSYNSIEEDNQVYVLNKNEQVLAIFNKDDEDTLINPRIEKKQNSESIFTFTIDMKNPKWEEINNPENLYLVDGMMFSTNFDGSFKENVSENDEKTIEVTAYERQQLLSRKFVRAWNSETGLEKIDTFMVVILSNGNLPLKNDDITINTRYPKGSSGYALEGLLYGTGWTVGTCDIYEYENGEVVKDENDNPVYAKFDLETDQTTIYDNILKIQELWGGILVFDSLNKIVHHRNETVYLPYNGYEVKYQKNMQSLEKKYNNKIITKLCPLGEGGLNIKSVNHSNVWLENYSYTNTVLEGIENNPDITDPTQLKRWGERKLQMLCRPSIELDVNVALLYQLDGYELETVDLNHIVDVMNYEDINLEPVYANGLYPRGGLYPSDSIYPIREKDKLQLRVIEFSYSVWNKSDATIKLSNITLDSTDIFRKTLIATSSINAGTLNASKVIAVYKGGQSLEATVFNIDEEKLNEEDFTGSNIMLAINEDTSSVTIAADKINLNGAITANGNFKIKTNGTMECKGATINNGNISLNDEGSEGNSYFSIYQYNNGNLIADSSIFSDGFFVNTYDASGATVQTTEYQGSVQCWTNNYEAFLKCYTDASSDEEARCELSSNKAENVYTLSTVGDNNSVTWIRRGDKGIYQIVDTSGVAIHLNTPSSNTRIYATGITTPSVTQTSLKSEKKNFEKFSNGLDIIKNIDIYKYNLKNEKNGDKKHLGFIIGEDFNYSKEITSKENDGVDTYSFISLCCQAIKEQQEQIEQMKKEIKELKGGK